VVIVEGTQPRKLFASALKLNAARADQGHKVSGSLDPLNLILLYSHLILRIPATGKKLSSEKFDWQLFREMIVYPSNKGKEILMREEQLYNASVMAGRPPSREAPLFGQRLATVRRSKGLTQRELADKLGVKRELIDYYERRAANPALDFIERAAQALGVTVAELLGSQPHTTRAKPGPVSQLQRKFEQVKLLPRKDQEFIIRFLDTVLERAEKA
jgi:transcriptional regulator with XRE-family HTH domain